MLDNLKRSVVEKDVENAYRGELRRVQPDAEVTSPYGTDGYAKWGTVRLLLEAKYDLDFKARLPLCSTLAQCLFYIKRFEMSGEPLPNVILVGDRNECFVLSTAAVKGFLDLPIKWENAPSTGDPALTRALVEQMNILPYVYDVNKAFRFRDVLEKVETLAAGEQHAAKATVSNIGVIFAYWRDNVFRDKRLTSVEQVDVFLKCLFDPMDVYLHPTKRGVLVAPGYPDGVVVNADLYLSFFDHFEQGYRPSEIAEFYARKDRLVEDDTRRRQGAFFTPDLWVAEAHKSIEQVLGENWRDECVVWNPAAGTANLTRDYRFRDLILSTGELADVRVIQEQQYNHGASVFQYDFLNPEGPSPFFPEGELSQLPAEVDAHLRAAAAAGKRLVFALNPPYGTAGVYQTYTTDKQQKRSTIREGIAKTHVNEQMREAALGGPSQQLYAQFMYQCSEVARQYGFTRHTVALFSVPAFMSSGSYRKFRNWWYARYEAENAFMFQASHFADVSSRWGISFTVWNSPGATDPGGTVPCATKSSAGLFVEPVATKAIYNSDDRQASKWVRQPVKGLVGGDAPQFSSGLRVKESGPCLLPRNALVYMADKSNCVMYSNDETYLMSSGSSRNRGFASTPANWRQAVALYGARKLVQEAWDTQKDEYLVPAPSDAYEQWVDDCHVYAIVHRHNNCTAMRDVQYKKKLWQVHNHFFWRTHRYAMDLLNTKETVNLSRDCRAHPSLDIFGNPVESSPDPYMASQLPNLRLSPEALEVMDRLDALWHLSLPVRETYAAGRPELHLLAWDSGVYQLKHLWRELFPDEWAALQVAFKALAAKLRPGVYEHGFLLP